MSNKNLKVYRMLFTTQIQQMQFKVKFPCSLKIIWKRSNQSAQTTLVPVQNGVVKFNQTLKLYVNMYFDTTTNKFVEKKCIYSFLIMTDKGEKSAGSITYDLAEFVNRRVYEVHDQFPLQKCPLPDTKVKMKIFYEQSVQTGYDSMSRISTSEQLDLSTVSMDAQQQSHGSSGHGQSSNKEQVSTGIVQQKQTIKSKHSESDTASKQTPSQKDKQQTQSNYDLLNESDLGPNIHIQNNLIEPSANSQKISQNIQALNKLTGKINEFVSRCSGNIKNQLQNLKHQNKTLQQSLSSVKFQHAKLAKQKQQDKVTIQGLKNQLNELKLAHESANKKQQDKYEELLHKYDQSQKLYQQMERNVQEKGQSQNSYLTQLKSSFQEREQKLKQKITNLQTSEQKLSSKIIQYQSQKQTLQNKLSRVQQKYQEENNKNKQHEIKQVQRQKQLTQLRGKMESVYEEIVRNLGKVVQL